MARRRNLPSLSTPIIMASIAVPIAIALLVGWTLVFAGNLAQGDDIATNVWLLVGGVIAFVALVVQMVMFAVFLGREILEVRKQDSFIDSVTHELKTPLSSIKLGLQTLGRPGLDDDKREYLRDMMLTDVDRLQRFVDDILQASRLAHDLDRVHVQQDDVCLAALVDELAESVRLQHKLAADAIRIEVDPDLILITDRAALSVVVRNLIDNAVKYSEAGAVEVTVQAKESPKGLVFEVVDRGIGIPEADLKRVFHRFYRVAAEPVRSRKGTGLGLFVVWALVRSLGGKVEAASDGPGTGTTMRVTLPANALPLKTA
ncbi:MAG: HAMP domain-containing histidine kinase [Myxococcales bacterium]|nr:HAMP domain-containing histidine kinase [Myxococcales bacterium]